MKLVYRQKDDTIEHECMTKKWDPIFPPRKGVRLNVRSKIYYLKIFI